MEPLLTEPEQARPGVGVGGVPPGNSAAKRPLATSKSPTRIALDRLRKDRVAVTCACIFVFFLLIAIFAPLLAKLEGQDIATLNLDLIDEYGFPTVGPNSEHWFGVEPRLGRDLFARWVYGARPSLIVATSVTLILSLIHI